MSHINSCFWNGSIEGLFGSFRNGGGGTVVIIKARQSSRMYQSPGNYVFIMTFTVSFLKTVEEGTWFWCKSCQGQVQLVPVSSLYPRVLDLGQGGASFQILPHPPPVTVAILTLRSLFSLHSKNHNTSKCFFIWDTKMQNCWDIKHFPISYNTATMYKRSDKCAHI